MFNGSTEYYHRIQSICMTTFPFPFYILIGKIHLRRGFENWIIIYLFIGIFKGIRIILVKKIH